MLTQLTKMMDRIEAIGIASVESDILHIRGAICYYWIPYGVESKEFYNDIKHNCYTEKYSDYITEHFYYTSVNPIPFNLMCKKLHLHKDIVEYLKKYSLNLYEVDIKSRYSEELDPLVRINNYEVKIKLPHSINKGSINFVLASEYQWDKLYYITTDGVIK